MASHWNCYISLGEYSSCPCRFPRNSPNFFLVQFHFSTRLSPTHGAFALPVIILSSPCSIWTPHSLALIDSSRSSSNSGLGSPSPHGHHERPSHPLFNLPGTCFRSKLYYCLHTIQQVISAAGRSLSGKFGQGSIVLASVSRKNLTPYMRLQ